MKDFFLESDRIQLRISSLGAELQSMFDKKHQVEYMWQADPAFWKKHSPVLFPIVGTLKDNKYEFDGNWYNMSRHGFAREMEFELTGEGENMLCFTLTDSESTKKNYPFAFRFQIEYRLFGKTLAVTYRVFNPSATETCWFSVGGHPAFRVPLSSNTVYNDYYLYFNEAETTGRWPISPQGLLEMEPIPFLNNEQKVSLTHSLFQKDAIVLKNLNSWSMQLRSDKNNLGFDFDFTGFDYIGIWAAQGADFVCIEPWCGIADNVESSGNFKLKEGIQSLEPGVEFERTWRVQLFE